MRARWSGLACLLLCCLCASAGFAQGLPSTVTFSGEQLYVDETRNQVTAEGNLQLTYQGLTLQAESGTLDLAEMTGTFPGKVTLMLEGQRLEGEKLQIDLRTGLWHCEQVKGTATPELLHGFVTEPLFLSGARAEGDAQKFELVSASATTCDKSRPHYKLAASKLVIYPGRRILLKHPRFELLHHTVFVAPSFSIPWQIVEQPEYFPSIGTNDVEGYYLKATFPKALSDSSNLALHLDLTEKRGTGVGWEYALAQSRQSAYARLYQETGSSTLTGQLDYSLQLSDSWNTGLNFDYRKNSAYAVENKTSQWEWQLNNTQAKQLTNLRVNYRRTQSYSTTRSLRADLSWRRTLPAGSLATTWLYTRYDSSLYAAANRDLIASLRYTHRGPLFDWELTSKVRDDLDGDDYTGDENYRYVSYRPMLTLRTDSRRSKLLKLGKASWQAQFGFADILEDPRGTHKTRLGFGFDLYQPALSFGKTQLNFSGTFDQYFYSDDTAQYIVSEAVDLKQDLGGKWAFSTGYQHRFSAGYTPFLFDQTYPSELARFRLERRTSASRLSFNTSYDLNQHRWYQLRMTGKKGLGRASSLYLSCAYDLENSVWRPLNLRCELGEGRFKTYATFSYDLEQDELTSGRANFDWQLARKWKLEGFAGYNGYTDSFDFLNVRLARTLHCWTGALTYDKSRRLVGLYFYINALPIMQPAFGTTPTGGSYYGGTTTYW